MNLREYQLRSNITDQNSKFETNNETLTLNQKNEIIPLMGLVGEVGGLLSEYKKMLRDGSKYQEFSDHVAEELGDILWYVANVATKFNLNLEKIAIDNLSKTEDRWYEPGIAPKLYDENCDKRQQLPRVFSYKFSHISIDGVEKLILTDVETGEKTGDYLTDNSYEDDGYRFHDVLHLAFMACLGWSPVFRKIFRDLKKIDHREASTDEGDDGGRAKVIEEAIIAAAYVYASQYSFLEDIEAVDWKLLTHIKQMTKNLEVKNRTSWEWNDVLIKGFKVWRALIKNNGGIVEGNMLTGELKYRPIPRVHLINELGSNL